MARESNNYELQTILKILKENGIDINRIPVRNGKDNEYIKLKDITQTGIDILEIIDKNNLNPNYEIGQEMVLFGMHNYQNEDENSNGKFSKDEHVRIKPIKIVTTNKKSDAEKESGTNKELRENVDLIKEYEKLFAQNRDLEERVARLEQIILKLVKNNGKEVSDISDVKSEDKEEQKNPIEKIVKPETKACKFIRVLNILREKGINDYTIYKPDPADKRKRKYVYLSDIIEKAVSDGIIRREDKNNFYDENDLQKRYLYGEILDEIRQRKLEMTPEQENFLEELGIFKLKPNKIRKNKTKKRQEGIKKEENTEEIKEEIKPNDLYEGEAGEFIKILTKLSESGVQTIYRYKAGKQNRKNHIYASLEDTMLRSASELDTYNFFKETGFNKNYPLGKTIDRIMKGEIELSERQRKFLQEKEITFTVNNKNSTGKNSVSEEERIIDKTKKEEETLKECIRRAKFTGKNIRQIVKVKRGEKVLFVAQIGERKNTEVIYFSTEGDLGKREIYDLLNNATSRSRITNERIKQVEMELTKDEQLIAKEGER